MKIENAVALVTGANRGIGAALVHALLERGAGRVYAAARKEAGRQLNEVRALTHRCTVRRLLPICSAISSVDNPFSTRRMASVYSARRLRRRSATPTRLG